MPEPTGRGSREFLPSANQALSELEETTGKPVMIVDSPELNVLATIRRAGPEDSSHVLRIKGGGNRVAEYLIVFQCRMALRDGLEPRAVRRLAERVMRANAQGMPRLDAVMYLSSALEAYRELDPEGQKQLLAEAGAVGQKGLSINNPEQNHHLQHFCGGSTVSALQVVCILYVGVQLLLPGQDAGIDFAREYELAKGMAGADL